MARSMFDLTGKVALVTGGNSGIGLGFAEGLAGAGADVCIWGTNEKKSEKAADELRRFGAKVEAIRCDVSEADAVKAAFQDTVGRMGKVDACFANAGIGTPGIPFLKMTPEQWHRIFEINLHGAVATFREAIEHMIERGEGGSLVGTASITSFFGFQNGEDYSTTKAGIVALIKGLSNEFSRHGIRANAVAPGWIETGMTDPVLDTDLFVKKIKPRIPQRRWGTREDLAGIAVYLASDASAYHTGDTITIDGGYRSM